ncbi:MAG: hypothetical protein IPL15_10785 [Comamonadaceae bacterium]|uniref:hypothetical protein n=1 Tax=Candidatus Skiveiella danica TaxID=3386177 RepID=UPI00390C189D|nr:hypothetical protein [Comamonadaceae bacterium]
MTRPERAAVMGVPGFGKQIDSFVGFACLLATVHHRIAHSFDLSASDGPSELERGITSRKVVIFRTHSHSAHFVKLHAVNGPGKAHRLLPVRPDVVCALCVVAQTLLLFGEREPLLELLPCSLCNPKHLVLLSRFKERDRFWKLSRMQTGEHFGGKLSMHWQCGLLGGDRTHLSRP